MLFNSLEFILFFSLLLLLLASSWGRQRWRAVLLAASFIFYAYSGPLYLGIFAASIAANWALGLRVAASGGRARLAWVWTAAAVNLGLLASFKYSPLAWQTWQALTGGDLASPSPWRWALPVGISFYTFQGLGYVLDVHRGQAPVCRSLNRFALFIAFFPQLVAGPIMRARDFMAQLDRGPGPQRLQRALYFLSVGFFKKVALADSLALMVDPVFASPETASWAARALALYAYAFQIYFDFSGYSDIAEGLASLMGFSLMQNFNAPYLATGPRDFWRRWHISLSTWLRDNLYIPLGGSRGSQGATLLALMLTMALGGLWHGGSWTFMLWGLYHGALLVTERAFPALFNGPRWVARALTFHLVLLGWLLFRAGSLDTLAAFFGPAQYHLAPRVVATALLLLTACGALHLWESRGLEQAHRPQGKALHPAALAGMHLAVAVAWLAGSGLSRPFLYFAF